MALAEPGTLSAAINRSLIGQTAAPVSAKTAENEVDLVSLLDSIFKEAFLRRSSDIHLMQDEFGLRVRCV